MERVNGIGHPREYEHGKGKAWFAGRDRLPHGTQELTTLRQDFESWAKVTEDADYPPAQA